MPGNFDACMEVIRPLEGGYVNHAADPGGETNHGISKRSYPNVNIGGLTWAGAKQIYRRDFWAPIRGDELPAGIDLATLDPSINSGPGRGVRWMQRALGVTQDGQVGFDTIAAAGRANPVTAIQQACAHRMGWLRGLKIWGTFGTGWSRRVATIEAAGVKMALTSRSVDPAELLRQEAARARDAARRDTTTGTAGAATGTGGLSIADLPDWALALGAVAVVVLLVILIGQARHNRTRAKAYDAAQET